MIDLGRVSTETMGPPVYNLVEQEIFPQRDKE
jgi:hypothetical protein